MGAYEMSGKRLRKGLAQIGIKRSGSAFYQLMARLEKAKFVQGRYVWEEIDEQLIKERNYKITSPGVRALNETKSFYSGRIGRMLLKP
jgi:hypothetical protein